jgi:prepilin-type N-terminal cleavage/methylation domain-containing protein
MNRRGLSLLEVMLALAILGGALTAIGMLVRLGSRAAVESREMTQAQLLCESKLAELTAGLLPVEPGGPWQFDLPEQAEWVYFVDIEPVPLPGMVQVTVTVAQESETARIPRFFSLVRWMQDPNVDLSDPYAAPAVTETTNAGP